ncbi:hypothetical protein [Methanobacterium sp.]|uniref:hypothetical protein n=1 Tax=Methanobacterium sp. TaxID=2164 RepID=UPI0025DFCCBA|nr:hypothetical protein [Methanobacterium sp.]MBI5458613.1 hypothetical protein [Methanobacterium sp.]
MNSNDIMPFIAPFISGLALLISIISVSYSYYQNRRFIEVTILSDTVKQDTIIKLVAYNPGYRSVALTKRQILANNEIKIEEGSFKLDEVFSTRIEPIGALRIPCVLKEGTVDVYQFNAERIATFLRSKGLSGEVQLSGYYELPRGNIYKSNTLNFNLDDYPQHK